jgi:hypothetical protein
MGYRRKNLEIRFSRRLVACVLLSRLRILRPKSRNVQKLILKNRKDETRSVTNAVVQFIPPALQTAVMGILSVAAVYFHISPSQTHNPPQS